ncbi:MAG: nuclear transport factor 2 family protein [Actinomycetota bacterium]
MLHHHEYAATFFRAVDERDWETWRLLVSPEITIRFANQPPMGAESFQAMVDGGATLIPRVVHRIDAVWRDRWTAGDVVVVEMEVSYELANGSSHVLPAIGVIRRRDGLAEDYRVVVDLSPVQASLGSG